MTAPPMWLPFGWAELRETAVAELEPHVRRLPGQLAQPRTRRATPSPPPRDDDGDEFDLRPPPSRVHELEEVPGEFRQ
ncbi:Os03g0394800 [Oryza sativa Japonica Group]|uniref:Os03g0394800 protein n=1 Tax=Oryza sativa subsp. japonica TaxID=39947 RepID=A0A0P0VZ83_ORYSJ|nr:Os03g0394800 [Oryza sativa Japonica Group]